MMATDPYLCFVYTSFQERATKISHGNTATLANQHGAPHLAKICRTIAVSPSPPRPHHWAGPVPSVGCGPHLLQEVTLAPDIAQTCAEPACSLRPGRGELGSVTAAQRSHLSLVTRCAKHCVGQLQRVCLTHTSTGAPSGPGSVRCHQYQCSSLQ